MSEKVCSVVQQLSQTDADMTIILLLEMVTFLIIHFNKINYGMFMQTH